MNDNELRGFVLRAFYEKRREGIIDVDQLGLEGQVALEDVAPICDQLAELGLLKDWDSIPYMGKTWHGSGQISAAGINIIEEKAKPPSSISFPFKQIIVAEVKADDPTN